MKWRENQIQIKLTLLVIIGILGILTVSLFTNSAFKSLRLAVKEFQYPDQKIRQLNGLLEQTNISDTYLRLYILTTQKEYLERYAVSIDSVNSLFASYRSYIQTDTLKSRQMDSIQVWWQNKIIDNKELLKLISEKPDLLVISKIMDETKDTTLFSTQISKEKIIHDSLVIIKKIPVSNEQRTGLLHKVKRVFSRKDDDSNHEDSTDINDNMNIEMYSYTHKKQDTIVTDTLVKVQPFNSDNKKKVKNVILEKLEFDTIINLKRLASIEKDFIIRNKISRQIKSMQMQEQSDAQDNITEIQNISTKTINQIFWFFLIILFTCLCLYIMLVLDAYRIKRYEERLLNEKKNYKDLANNRAQFLSMMAHELRTPLQSIIGFSELMEEKQKNTSNKSYQYTDIIKKSSVHLLQTINLLLDRSKIDAGKLELEQISFNLNETIHDVFQSLSIQAGEKGIAYILSSDIPKDFLVYSDSFRLKQILFNLLNNAIKFTNNGSVKLTCKFQPTDNQPTAVHFTISDTGIGIPKEKIKKLFEEYHQLDKSTGRLFGGTGLGLVITKKILNLFNSDLSVESDKTGTSFLFTINFQETTLIEAMNVTDSIDLNGTSILVVDDDSYNLLYTHQLLNTFSLSVSICSTIQEAIQHIKAHTPDIILCDLYINESMGTDLIPFVNPATKIIFMSADHDRLNELKTNNLILPKPFTPNNLIAVLHSLGIKGTSNADIIPILDASLELHQKSLLEKMAEIETAMLQHDAATVLYFVHQIKTTLGYLNRWEDIKHLQKAESHYDLHKDDLSLFQVITDVTTRWKQDYSR